MNGKLAWLVGGALAALMLGGCVAEAVDDEQVAESEAALVEEQAPPGHAGLQGVADPGQGLVLVVPTGDPGDPYNGSSCSSEPEPNPWQPPGSDPGKQAGGTTATDQQQQGPQATGPQGQMKH